MIPKPFFFNTLSCHFCGCLFIHLFHLLLLLLLLLLFLKFAYSRMEDYIKEFSDDGNVNLGSPPSERYTVTNLVPDTFYNFYFIGISSCGQRLSQIIKAKTIGSGKLGPISYLYIFFGRGKETLLPPYLKLLTGNW